MVEQIAKLRAKAKKEIRKVVVLTNIKEVVGKLFEIMENHVGESKKISRVQLFSAVYGIDEYDVSELQAWLLWELCRRAMHTMRQRTKCFIVSKCFSLSKYSARNQGIWYYWVASDFSDLKVYSDNIERNIKAMRSMVSRCQKSVEQKWYKEAWEYK